jgi:hypothetical protein
MTSVSHYTCFTVHVLYKKNETGIDDVIHLKIVNFSRNIMQSSFVRNRMTEIHPFFTVLKIVGKISTLCIIFH